jgi:hypothetical protein
VATKPSPVVDANRYGASQTGTDFGYLVSTAQRESSLDPAAKAKTSSASGLFQFIEQTWLGLIKSDGGKYGLGNLSQAISETGDGRFDIADPTLKRDVLALRSDPKVAAVMAGALTQKNRETLSGTLGRAPSEGELYIAHVLGAQGASTLIQKARANAGAPAAADFPEAAAANRSIFYDRAGRARGAGEVYALLAAAGGSAPNAAATAFAPVDQGPLTAAPVYAQGGPALYGLFRTEGGQGPISNVVHKLWTVRGGANDPIRPAADARPYFPRSESAPAEPAASAVADVASEGVAVLTPLPPVRPTQGGAGSSPLDLTSFTKRRRTL